MQHTTQQILKYLICCFFCFFFVYCFLLCPGIDCLQLSYEIHGNKFNKGM